jgi:hypothetical protein
MAPPGGGPEPRREPIRQRPMTRTRRGLSAVLVAVVLVGCSRGSSPSGGGQGIDGVVLAGPTCPVESAESPCPPKPLPGIRVQVLSGGDEVAEATTAGDGSFSVALEPGTYLVQAAPGQQGFMSSRPVPVTVTEGSFARVTVSVDTGIR